jgi:hypothetical protein
MHMSAPSLNHLLRFVMHRCNGMCMENRNFSKNHSVLDASSDCEVYSTLPIEASPPSH